MLYTTGMVERTERDVFGHITRYNEEWCILFESKDDVSRCFSGEVLYCIGIHKNDQGEWGHWDYDIKTGQKYWNVVEVADDVEDLRITHKEELEQEAEYWKELNGLFDKAQERGLEFGSDEFNVLIGEGMAGFYQKYNLPDPYLDVVSKK